MKTMKFQWNVIPAHAGISFKYQSGDSCMRRNDKKLKFSHGLMRRNDKKLKFSHRLISRNDKKLKFSHRLISGNDRLQE
ncbi:MAG: hypothetical protein NT007_01750 [Candidatus Kapabacteria bacterium]|nr:hypothetical protein [Candidatus Kapabacteria bacterium]